MASDLSRLRGGGIAKAILTASGTRPDDNYIKTEPLNDYEGGVCRTIKAQYQQSSRANFVRQDGLGATGVIEYGNLRTISEQGQEGQGSETKP